MITNNFRLLINKKIFNNSNYYAFKGTNGSTAGGTSAGTVFSSNNYNKVTLGSGNTPPTVDDLSLENKINDLTLLTRTMDNSSAAYGDVNGIVTYTAVYKNNTENNITVSELGVEAGEGYTSSGWGGIVLLVREVITPITIAPGETYTFTVKIG